MADVTIDVVQGAINDPAFILKAIGGELLRISQKAFREQRLGSIRWKRRYPNQRPPLLNIAGALADFKNRDKPKGRRFDGRPVLEDTKALYGSLNPKKGGNINIKGKNVVEVGSNLPYAGVMQNGGISVQPVSGAQKQRIAKWIKGLRGSRRKIATFDTSSKTWGPKKTGGGGKKAAKPKGGGAVKGGKKGTPKKASSSSGSSSSAGAKFKQPKSSFDKGGAGAKKLTKASLAVARAQKMGFLFSRSQLRTKVVARPFLGITAEAEREIRKIVERGMERGKR
jgi:phage gpG-like protein